MKSEYQEWQDELAGKKPHRSGWWLVLIGLVMVVVAVKFL